MRLKEKGVADLDRRECKKFGVVNVDNLEKDEKVQHFANIVEEMTELYEKKNHDYGDSFKEMFNEFGMTSALIRLSDKYRRLKTLAKSDAKVNESVRDTLIDLACYAVMTIIELEDRDDHTGV